MSGLEDEIEQKGEQALEKKIEGDLGGSQSGGQSQGGSSDSQHQGDQQQGDQQQGSGSSSPQDHGDQ